MIDFKYASEIAEEICDEFKSDPTVTDDFICSQKLKDSIAHIILYKILKLEKGGECAKA